MIPECLNCRQSNVGQSGNMYYLHLSFMKTKTSTFVTEVILCVNEMYFNVVNDIYVGRGCIDLLINDSDCTM